MTNEDKFGKFDLTDLKPFMDRIDAEIKQIAEVTKYHGPLYINQEATPVTNEISEERIAKIQAAWVRDVIRNQQREIAQLRQTVDTLSRAIGETSESGEIEADTWVDGGIDADVPLPKHTHINFGRDGRDFRAWINPDGDLEINSANGAILVNPRAANAIIVKLADRR